MINKLDAAIKAVCPIHGVSIGRKDDKSTWRIDFKDEATTEQRAAAQAVLDAFDPVAAEQPTPQERIAEMEKNGIPEQKIDGGYVRGVREYMLGMAQIVVALGGPDVMVTPGMQKVKKLDDAIKVQRALIQ